MNTNPITSGTFDSMNTNPLTSGSSSVHSYCNTRPRDNTRKEKSAIDFVKINTKSENTSSLDVSKQILDNLSKDLPDLREEIDNLKRLALICETWETASDFQKTSFSLHLSGSRSKEIMKGICKHQFIFTHQKKSYLAGSSKRTMERANLFWENTGCFKKAIRKRVGINRTLNFYHKDHLLNEIRVVANDQLFINFFNEEGVKEFLPIRDYIQIQVKNFQKLEKNRQEIFEESLHFVKGCRPNYTEYKYINTSTEGSLKRTQISKNNVYIRQKLGAGISFLHGNKKVKLSEQEIEKFLWYPEENIVYVLETLQDISEKRFRKIKNPIHYAIACCRNMYNGDYSWKAKKASPDISDDDEQDNEGTYDSTYEYDN